MPLHLYSMIMKQVSTMQSKKFLKKRHNNYAVLHRRKIANFST